MKKIKSVAVLQEDKTFGEKIPLGTDSDKVDVSTALEETFQTKEIALEKKTVDGAFEKLLEYAEVTKDEITSALEYTPVKSVNEKTGEEVTLEKADVGLSNVENKSAETILGEMDKQNVVDALGYEPPVNDTQGINLIKGTGTPTDIVASSASQYNFKDFEFTIGTLVPGETYTVSADINILNGDIDSIRAIVTKDKESSYTNQGTTLTMPIENGRIVGQITVEGNSAVRLLIYAGIPGSTANNGVRVSNLKFEEGVVQNPQWSPAPEDVATHADVEQAVTGENLLLDSDTEKQPSGRILCSWKMTKEGIIDEWYTLTVCITPGSDTMSIALYRDETSGMYAEKITTKGRAKQVVSLSFKNISSTYAVLKTPTLIADQASQVETIVHWAKLERGVNLHPFWTPSPYDIVSVKDNHILVIGS